MHIRIYVICIYAHMCKFSAVQSSSVQFSPFQCVLLDLSLLPHSFILRSRGAGSCLCSGALTLHRSHFGSRYKSGWCGHAGLLGCMANLIQCLEFPDVYLWFGFTFLRFIYDFPLVFLKVFPQGFSWDPPLVFLIVPEVFLWFSWGFPQVFLGLFKKFCSAFPQGFSSGFPQVS